MYACLYILEIWNVKLYDYPELILIFYRLVTFKNLLNTLPSQDRDTPISNMWTGGTLSRISFYVIRKATVTKRRLTATGTGLHICYPCVGF